MTKNYCDRCGAELKEHKGHFIKFVKTCQVLWFSWHIIDHTKKSCFDEQEMCEECYDSFLELYDKFMDADKTVVNVNKTVTVTFKE